MDLSLALGGLGDGVQLALGGLEDGAQLALGGLGEGTLDLEALEYRAFTLEEVLFVIGGLHQELGIELGLEHVLGLGLELGLGLGLEICLELGLGLGLEISLGVSLKVGVELGLELDPEVGLGLGLDPLHDLGDLDGSVHTLGCRENGARLALGGLEDGLALGGLDEPGIDPDVLLGDHVQDLDDLPDLDEPGLEPDVLLSDHVQDLDNLPDLDELGLKADFLLGDHKQDLDEEELVPGGRAGQGAGRGRLAGRYWQQSTGMAGRGSRGSWQGGLGRWEEVLEVAGRVQGLKQEGYRQR